MTISGSTFKAAEPMLHELLDSIHKKQVQLPDFQRGWVWDDHHIRSLLASVSLSYPIGAVMMLEAGGEGVRFKPRPVEGVDPEPAVEPDKLILDGQQRLTSMYLAVRSPKPVPTRTERGREVKRHYYFDLDKATAAEGDRIDAIVSVPEDRIIRSNFGRDIELDLTSREKEHAAGMIPCDIFFDFPALAEWRNGYQKHYQYTAVAMERWQRFEQEVHFRFQQYKLPVIELLKTTPKEAVCQVFEKVNTGGVSLTVFELVTATFAADNYSLRDDWDARRKQLKRHKLLSDVSATDILTAVTLLSSYRRMLAGTRSTVSCKRSDVLNLTLAQYQSASDAIQDGLLRAEQLLMREHVYEARNLPYGTQLMPLAAICAALGNAFHQDNVKKKLARWYWCGVFGELYGGSTETRFAFDLPEFMAWIDGGPEPRTVRDGTFTPGRLLSLQTRRAAAYKGVAALLLEAGSHDFISGDPIELTTYFDYAIDIHHIFPRKWCETQRLHRDQWNSVVNKAPLTARTNRSIGGHAPSKYLASIDGDLGAARVNQILETHLIAPEQLRRDDFAGFLRTRASVLLDAIERATGRQIQGRDADETIHQFGGALLPAQA